MKKNMSVLGIIIAIWIVAGFFVHYNKIHGASATFIWFVAVILTLGLCRLCEPRKKSKLD